MAIVIKPITVEVSKPNVFQAIAAKQNDSNSRFLKVTFVNEGEKIYVMPSSKVTINAERNDGQSNSFFGAVNDDGTVTVPIHSWILELPGYVDCDISIIEEDSKLTCTTFSLLVEEASYGDDDVSQDPQTNVLGDLIKEVETLETGMNNVFASAIHKTVSGTAISLRDISSNPNTLEVKLEYTNLCYSYRSFENTNIENGVVTQVIADTRTTPWLKCAGYKNGSHVETLTYTTTMQLGVNALTFTKTDAFDTISFGLIGAAKDTTIKIDVSHLADGEYTVQGNFTNLTQGSVSWKETQIVKGNEAKQYINNIPIKVSGKNLIPFPFYYNTDRIIQGVEFTLQEDRGIRLLGTATADAYFYLSIGIDFGTSMNSAATNSESATNGVYAISKRLMYYAAGKELAVLIPKGTSVDEVIYPQLEVGIESSSYEAFKGITEHYSNIDGVYEIESIYPTTTIIADGDCGVTVSYTMDTEKAIEETKSLSSSLYKKTIVNFGDSIFGNNRPPYDISTAIANRSGAIVHNCGFGGCRMSAHPSANFDAFSMYRLAYAIANNDWSVQDNAINIGGVPNYFGDTLALLKSIDFSKVDVITIAYGTNDFTADVPLADSEVYTNFPHSMRYSIETILTAFPHIKIFVCGQAYRFWIDSSNNFVDDSDTHTNSNGVKLTDYVAKTREIAKEYHVAFIDNYHELGINKHNRGYYFPVNDGTHHNRNGVTLIADHIASELF